MVVVVEGAERADDGDEYRHRVRVVVKSVEESNEVLVDQPVRADLPLKLSPLFTRGRTPRMSKCAQSAMSPCSARSSMG